jgi:hypothetical protein
MVHEVKSSQASGLELDIKPGGVALDVLVETDLSQIVKHRT